MVLVRFGGFKSQAMWTFHGRIVHKMVYNPWESVDPSRPPPLNDAAEVRLVLGWQMLYTGGTSICGGLGRGADVPHSYVGRRRISDCV